MTTGAMPPNLTFMSSKRIMPHISVKTHMYNEAGFIPHPLSHFGRGGGVHTLPYFGSDRRADKADKPTKQGQEGISPGGGAHFITGRANGMNY